MLSSRLLFSKNASRLQSKTRSFQKLEACDPEISYPVENIRKCMPDDGCNGLCTEFQVVFCQCAERGDFGVGRDHWQCILVQLPELPVDTAVHNPESEWMPEFLLCTFLRALQSLVHRNSRKTHCLLACICELGAAVSAWLS